MTPIDLAPPKPRYYVVQCAICGTDLLCTDDSQPRACASHAQPAFTKRVGEYDPTTRQYPAYVSIDGEPEQLVGIRWTAGAADQACDEYIFQYYVDRHTPEAAARTPARSAPPADEERDIPTDDPIWDRWTPLEDLDLPEEDEE